MLDLLARAQQGAIDKASDKPSPYMQTPTFDKLGDRYNHLNGNQYGDLVELLIGGMKPMSGSAMEDWNKQILDAILQKYFQNDQRAYDRQVLEEQRAYDNPLNALSRLTGAGIGRDAAIQMLSGAGSGAGIGAGSGAGVTAPQGVPPSQSALNAMQTALAPISTLFSAASTVGSLVSLGLSVPSAIAQGNILSSQAKMTQETANGLAAANQVGQAFSNLVADGTLSLADLDSMSNADDALKYAEEHRETNGFAPLFAPDGAFSKVVGTKSGREMFANYWDALRSNRNAGDVLDFQLRTARLQELLGEVQTSQAQRDFYISFEKSMNDLLLQDAELADYYQKLRNGEIEIKINGQILQQQRYATKAAKRNDETDSAYHQAFKDFLEQGRPETIPTSASNGQSILSYHVWSQWYQSMCHDLATSNTGDNRELKWKDGWFSGSSADLTAEVAQAQQEVAITGLVLQKAINENRVRGFTGDFSPLYQFFDMFNASGGDKAVSAGTSVIMPFIKKYAP